ncbi:MAG: hypothetical protein AAB470_00445 [Patescibacteria group bacterium]
MATIIAEFDSDGSKQEVGAHFHEGPQSLGTEREAVITVPHENAHPLLACR